MKHLYLICALLCVGTAAMSDTTRTDCFTCAPRPDVICLGAGGGPPLGDVTTPIEDPRVYCETRCVERKLITRCAARGGIDCGFAPDDDEMTPAGECLKRVRFCGELVKP